MADNVNLIVNNTIDNVNINPSIIDEIVDINVYDTATSIDINVTPNLTIVNVSQITGGEGGGGGTGNTNLLYVPSDIDGVIESDTGADATIPLADAVNAGLLSPSEKIKLETVTQGAEPNVNADWNATSGDAQILNKPAIPSISGLATVTYVDTQDALKVDKVPSYSLTKNDLTDALKSAYDSAVSWILTNGSNLISHLTNYSNPHQVTTTQIGAYTTTQVDTIANTKVDKNTAITAATKTKITYDTKGLVTNGVDATTADIADSSNKRYVTDANLTVIGNTSGTNTGDQNLQAVTNLGATTTTSITANSFIKQDGESYQFLKANGSVDSNVYLTSDDLPSTLDLYATTTASDISGYTVLVRTIVDPRYNTTAVDVSTGVITDIEQLVGSLITDANIISGNPGIFDLTTTRNIRRTSGSGESVFFFRIYKRTLAGTETLIAQSDNTIPVIDGGTYVEFSAKALWNDGIFLETDRVVIKYYASRLTGGSDPTYDFQFGGISPVRSSAAIPTSVIPNIYLRDLADVENVDALNNEILYWNDTASLWEHSLAEDLVPLATATQKGLVSTTTQTFAGAKTFTGTIGASNLSGTNTGDNATNTQYSGLATSKQDKITLTVTGINGAATLTGATLNIPQYSGATDLQTTRTSTTFTIVSSTGADAEVPLGNGTLAGATSNDYTSAEKTKLSGIATGATVGVVPNGAIPAATNTKITYDAKGLVTGGTSLIATDIPTITQSQVTSLTTDLALKAPLLSPIFTGTPVAVTPPISNNSTRLATTEYVDRQVGLGDPNNINIATSVNITTEATGTAGGISYPQYGKNVMVANGVNAITITVTTTTTTDFIASYTKLGTANITFVAGAGTTLRGFPEAVPVTVINGVAGSTALLTRTANIFYLQVNNLS